jgi:enterochelin esterase-like enzyme
LPSSSKRAGAATLALLAAAALLSAARSSAAPRLQDIAFRSVAIDGTLHFSVYLPADYGTTTTRYPVIYVLHGLPASNTAYQGLGFVESALDRAGGRAILVAPQASRASDTDPEYLNLGPGNQWNTALTQELLRAVDGRYRTIASRGGRAIIGLSAGGYGAMHLGLENLDRYSVVESWSGYFHPTDPTGTKSLDLGSDDANTAANVHRQFQASARRLKALPTFIAFYVGKDDTRFAAENQQLNQELSRAGIPHVFRLYPGGHQQSLWAGKAATWLALALAHLSPATG